MKEIIIALDTEKILLDDVDTNKPIFAMQDGDIRGMIIEDGYKGWILKVGGKEGATGYYISCKECMESCFAYGYTFYCN